MSTDLNEEVRAYWEAEPCGTGPGITGSLTPLTKEWFERVEQHRYKVEPFIHSFAQFTRRHGQRLLEVGVGAGTDHLQWARAGADCFGVDLTNAGIATTRARLAMYGLTSQLQRIDAEELPFGPNFFDVVYSWGVIHHSEHPDRILAEIHRVLKPNGEFICMMYGRRSLVTLKEWIKHALLKGKPWRSFADILWHHMESVGTKAYTTAELRTLFRAFSSITLHPVLTSYDTSGFPTCISRYFPDSWGWFIVIKAKK